MYGLLLGRTEISFLEGEKKEDGRMNNRQKWKGKKKPNLKAYLLGYGRSDRQRHDRTLHLTLPRYQHTL